MMMFLLFVVWLECIRLHFRNNKVHAFRKALLEQCVYRLQCEIDEVGVCDINYMDKVMFKNSYARMLFSYRKLEIQKWFTREELKDLLKYGHKQASI